MTANSWTAEPARDQGRQATLKKLYKIERLTLLQSPKKPNTTLPIVWTIPILDTIQMHFETWNLQSLELYQL